MTRGAGTCKSKPGGVLWVSSRGLGRGTVELDTPACVGPGKGALVAVLVAQSRCFGVGGDGTRLAEPARR